MAFREVFVFFCSIDKHFSYIVFFGITDEWVDSDDV